MIRTILATAALLTVATVAQAGEVKVHLSGKTDSVIRAEIFEAAKQACSDASVAEYAPCVYESAQDALRQVAKAKAAKVASIGF